VSEIEALEAKIRELKEYLLKLEQLHEKCGVTDEVYQELKKIYSKELEKYEVALDELKKRLEGGEQTRVVRVTQGLQASALPEPVLGTKVYSPPRKTKVIKRSDSDRIKDKNILLILFTMLFSIVLGIPMLYLITVIVLFIVSNPILSLIILIVSIISIIAGYYSGSK